jgi:hypothetical protein
MLIELSRQLSHSFKARECLLKLALAGAKLSPGCALPEIAPRAEQEPHDPEYAAYDIEKPVIFDRELIEKCHPRT